MHCKSLWIKASAKCINVYAIEDWKNVALSRFLLRHSDGRVRIWRKEHESMDPSSLVSMVQAGGGVMVWGIFSWQFGPLSTNWASFKHHRLPEYCFWPCPSLYDTVYPSSDDYFQQDNAPSQSSNHLRLVSWTWKWVNFTQMASTVTRSQSNRAPLGCGGTRFASWTCSRQICSVMLSCQYGPKSLRNVSNTLLNLCHGELRQFWRQKGVQPGTSKVYLIKWPVGVYVWYKHLHYFKITLNMKLLLTTMSTPSITFIH